jgi:formylglycine-generating enzyme required for sulfatase activity
MARLIFVLFYLLLWPVGGMAETISEVQAMLGHLGYLSDPPNGILGPKTKKAIKKFQADHKLSMTGKMDEATVNALKAGAPSPVTKEAAAPVPPATVPGPIPPKVPAPHTVEETKPIAAPVVVATPPSELHTLSPSVQAPPEKAALAPVPVAPLPVEEAKAHIAVKSPKSTMPRSHSDGKTTASQVIKSPDGLLFVRVPGGCFKMGGGNIPTHDVCVHEGSNFVIGQYEITQGQWSAVMGNNPAFNKRGDDYPIENVSWNDVGQFIAKLNTQGHGHYRLPSEAEWEYSARAGSTTTYWWGEDLPVCSPGKVNGANFKGDDCANAIVPVGTYQPNPFGLYDVHGNVWEWVEDVYRADAYDHYSKNDPVITEGSTSHVFRGGSWLYPAEALAVFYRDQALANFQFPHLGFRLVYEP